MARHATFPCSPAKAQIRRPRRHFRHPHAEDAKHKFNRAENVRQIPPGDPDFEVLYRRRNDAESINRHLDDTLWLRRAHSVGNRRQLLNLVTYALGVNALSMHVRRQGLAPPQAA